MCEEDRLFLQSYTPAIFWNDVDCYYWAQMVRLPSGHLCEFKVSRDGQKWKYSIVPTWEEFVQQQEEEKKKEIEWLKRQSRLNRKRKMEREIQENLDNCIKGLKVLENLYSIYFGD